MNPEQFAYWLQGFLEMSETKTISEKQVQIIKDHLNLVFEKKTPNRADLLKRIPKSPKEFVDLLNPICSNTGSSKTYC